MMKSYFEEFEKKYNRPQMNNITVGFSGIDPAPRSNETIVTPEIVIEALESLIIDGGEIT